MPKAPAASSRGPGEGSIPRAAGDARQPLADRTEHGLRTRAGIRLVWVAAVGALLGMLVYEYVRSLILPAISSGVSRLLTIVFSTTVATVVTAAVVGRLQRLSERSLAALGALQESEGRVKDAEHLVRDLTRSSATQARFASLVEESADVVLITDPTGRVSYESPSAERVTGFAAGSRGEFDSLERLHLDDLPLAEALLAQIVPIPGASVTAELRILHRDGDWRWVDARATNMLEDPAVAGLVINYRDITDRKKSDDAVREQSAALQLLAAVATAANTAVSVQEALSSCLEAVCAYTGWVVGHAYLVTDSAQSAAPELVSSGALHDEETGRYEAFTDASRVMTFLSGVGLPGRVLATGKALWNIDLSADDTFLRSRSARDAGLVNGHFLPVYEHAEVVAVLEFFDQNREPVTAQEIRSLSHVSAQVGRVVARHRAAARLDHEVLHDALTGLPNRRLFNNRLEHALDAARRRHGKVAVLLIDLDWFKTINDSLGHPVGDGILCEISDRLRHQVRPGDTVARLGGDEFGILLGEVADSSDGYASANRILDVLRSPVSLDDSLLAIQGSIGIALSDSNNLTAGELLRNADIAMYRAKAAGRGQAVLFTQAMHASARLRLALGGDLQRALDASEFALYYQPKLALSNGRVTGTEALLRWRHPQLGSISPAQFIPVAEETGLILALGEWVLNQACAQTAEWQEALPADRALSVAVNVSVKQFGPTLTGTVAAALRRSGLAPDRLTLEITESLLLDDDHALAQMSELKALGVRLSIDDFGTGYSSLSRLRSFPLDELKIDKTFIDEITTPDAPAPMVSAVITLAHAVGAVVVAEGVETAAQLAFLTAHHCDAAQGYLFSPPVPETDMLALLTATDLLSRM